MSKFAGKNGKVTFDGDQVLNVSSWQFTHNCNVSEVTVMSATDWKEFISGQYDWEATVEAYVSSTLSENIAISLLGDGDSSEADVDKYYLQLQFDQTATSPIEIKGYAFLIGKSIQQDNDNPTKATYSFRGIASTLDVGPVEGAV